MRIRYGTTIQKSDESGPDISIAEAAMNLNGAAEATIPGTIVSYSEICTKLVSRWRFSKEDCLCERSC